MDAETYRLEVDTEGPLGELRWEYPQADRVVALPQTLSTQESTNSTEKNKYTGGLRETRQRKQEKNSVRKDGNVLVCPWRAIVLLGATSRPKKRSISNESNVVGIVLTTPIEYQIQQNEVFKTFPLYNLTSHKNVSHETYQKKKIKVMKMK